MVVGHETVVVSRHHHLGPCARERMCFSSLVEPESPLAVLSRRPRETFAAQFQTNTSLRVCSLEGS